MLYVTPILLLLYCQRRELLSIHVLSIRPLRLRYSPGDTTSSILITFVFLFLRHTDISPVGPFRRGLFRHQSVLIFIDP